MFFFFFNDTATTEIYTLSLHDALPISRGLRRGEALVDPPGGGSLTPSRIVPRKPDSLQAEGDRKSTRLNSSHANISYAVFCLKKKINHNICDRHCTRGHNGIYRLPHHR